MPPNDSLGGELRPTPRTTLRRKRDRGHFDRATINSVLDAGLFCHVGFSVEGSPFVVPMVYARIGDTLYVHGAAANRTLRALATGVDACVTVTLVDGVVLARSAFHHSMNYRSVMLFGRADRVVDEKEQLSAMAALLEHLAPGRSTDARAPSPIELTATLILRFPITEGSAKIRTGGPIDEPEDLDLPVWAGVVPFALVPGPAVADAALDEGVEMPAYVRDYPRWAR
jgi:hypothetical protein